MKYNALWPELTMISCWADAASKQPAQELGNNFPRTIIAPKGIIATEGILSFPLLGYNGSALAVCSHFYEFVPRDDPGKVLSACQLEKNQQYSVLLTTGGGLYRYKLYDVIKVKGMLNECPLLEFIAKEDHIVDIYGEKLNENFVTDIFEGLFNTLEQKPYLMLLAPDGYKQVINYTLFIAGGGRISYKKLLDFKDMLESELQKNMHYKYCRRLEQLQSVEICWLKGAQEKIMERYLGIYHAAGQKTGNIKMHYLTARNDLRKNFAEFIILDTVV